MLCSPSQPQKLTISALAAIGNVNVPATTIVFRTLELSATRLTYKVKGGGAAQT
jgi:hypothetical protein